MALDYSTLGLILLAVASLNSLLLIAAAVMWRHLPGPLWWALGGLASAVTAAGFILPTGLQDPTIVALTIAGTFANLVFTHRGITLFNGRRDGLLAAPLIAVAAMAAITVLELIVDRPAFRALVFLVATAVIVAMIVQALLRDTSCRTRLPLRLVAFVYVATAAVLAYRLASIALGDAIGAWGDPPTRDAITMGSAVLLSNLRLFGLYLMVAARLQEEATRHAEAMRRDATQDALTGLSNRRALFAAADTTHADWPAHGPYAVIMLDLDGFKAINDRFGHGGGDEALRIVAAFLAATARPQDIVARLGGEEFVIVLPGCAAAEAMSAAETMRLGMHRLTVVISGQAVGVTASLGLAVVDAGDHDFAAVLNRADRALYAAKAAGRDRVKLEPGGGRSPRHSRTLRRHGRPSGRDHTPVPMMAIDGARHFNPEAHAAYPPADTRRHH